MAFKNKIRLPFYLSRPQTKANKEVYVRSNGSRFVTSAELTKEYDGRTDWMPAELHDKMHVALIHEEVSIVSKKFNGEFFLSGDYEVEWQDNALDYQLAPAKFRGLLTDFTETKANCGVCEEFSTVNAEDDTVDAAEGEELVVDTKANDVICCADPVYSILSNNSDVVDSASIDPATGVATIQLKTPIFTDTYELIEYQVECDGVTSTAKVYANIEGTASEPPAACPPPTGLTSSPSGIGAQPAQIIEWVNPVPFPALGLEGSLYEVVGGVETLIYSWAVPLNTITEEHIAGLDYDTDYRAKLKSKCSETSESDDVEHDFSTEEEVEENIMIVAVTSVEVPIGGGNSEYFLQAQIVVPAGVTSGSVLSIFATHNVGGTGYLANVDIPIGDTIAITSVPTYTGASSLTHFIDSAAVTPPSVTGSDSITYNTQAQY